MKDFFKPFVIMIGARYTRAKRKTHFVSFISLVSMLGIALGVMALITVLSVMNGFDYEIRNRILSMTPHVTVYGWGQPVEDWQQLNQTLLKHDHVIGVAPFTEGQAMLSFHGRVNGVLIKGIEPGQINSVYPLASKMTEGSLDALQAGSYKVVLGAEIAKHFKLKLGDKITLVAPESVVSPMGVMPKIKRFEVAGIFSAGYMYDANMAFVHMADAAKLYALPDNAVSGIQLKLDNYLSAPRIAKETYNEFNGQYYVGNWTTQNASYFEAIKMQKTLMFLILALIIAVATFNLVSTLVMLVTDKMSDIAILRTFGASPSMVMGIFVVQGFIVGLIGTILGLVAGVTLALNLTDLVDAVQKYFEVQFMSADVYFISFLPSKLAWQDVLKVCSVSFGLSLLATLYPAWRAAKIQPAEALRYE